jgi:hypothetical protein
MTEEDPNSYKNLKKKIKKLGRRLEKIKTKKGGEDGEEYQACVKEQGECTQLLQRTREFKAKKLQKSMDDIRGVTTPESDSEPESEEEEEPEPVIVYDFKLLKKKLSKVGKLLEGLIEEHGEDKASKRKDYKNYLTKQQEYLEQLETTDERKEEVAARQAEEAVVAEKEAAEAAAMALKTKIEEDRLAEIAAKKNGQKTELEKAKAEALAKLRGARAAREEKELEKTNARKAARKAADDIAMKESRAMAEETANLGRDFKDSLKDQEDRGMIKMKPCSTN